MKGEEEAFKRRRKSYVEASDHRQPQSCAILPIRSPSTGRPRAFASRSSIAISSRCFPQAAPFALRDARRDLLMLVGKVVAKLPNNISVTGFHTDNVAMTFTAGSGRDNWTLSTERANISREYLVQAGVDEKRISTRLRPRRPRSPLCRTIPKMPAIAVSVLCSCV